MILNRAYAVLTKLSAPLTDRMPEIILGFDGSNLVVILFLILICFFSGMMFRSHRVRNTISKLEESVLMYIPGYAMVKSITTDTIGESNEHNMTTVLLRAEDGWNIGFLVEEADGLCTVFIPEAPRHDSGEIKIVPADSVRKVNVSTHKAARSMQRYGKGALSWSKHL